VNDFDRYRDRLYFPKKCPTRLLKIVYKSIGDVFGKKSYFYNKGLIYKNFKEGKIIQDPEITNGEFPIARDAGIHGCNNIENCFLFYDYATPFIICEISPTENTFFDYSYKYSGNEVWALSEIKIVKILSKKEALSLLDHNNCWFRHNRYINEYYSEL